jgi:DNA-binding PadR family transcriptional regulator
VCVVQYNEINSKKVGDYMSQKDVIVTNLVGELKRGTLVLSVLLNTKESTYGYSLVQALQSLGIDIEQNTLYPLLRRLEKQALLSSSWDTTESRPRKYYQISPLGLEVLSDLTTHWQETNRIIHTMLKEV